MPSGPACPSVLLFLPAAAVCVPLDAGGEGCGGGGVARRAPAAPPEAGPGPVSALVPAGRALHEELIWKPLDFTSAPLWASGWWWPPPVAGHGPVPALVLVGITLDEELIWKILDLTSAPLWASGVVAPACSRSWASACAGARGAYS